MASGSLGARGLASTSSSSTSTPDAAESCSTDSEGSSQTSKEKVRYRGDFNPGLAGQNDLRDRRTPFGQFWSEILLSIIIAFATR